MAAGYKSPLWVLGFGRSAASNVGFKGVHPIMGRADASLVTTPDGFRSVFDFWLGGMGEDPTATGGWWHKTFVRNR